MRSRVEVRSVIFESSYVFSDVFPATTTNKLGSTKFCRALPVDVVSLLISVYFGDLKRSRICFRQVHF